MSDPQPRYLSFLVRLWQPGHNGAALWHASLENPHTAERHYFANLEALFAFLEEQTTTCVGCAESADATTTAAR
jgi:hypothetical protein